ncbi:MAG: glycosyltransferase family 2 protein [Thermoflexales bacterium]|nr:glycosyltransferase family 2 protein [Thermoflexales bacterium]
MKLSSVSVFFPCYNDAGTIPTMILRALEVLPTITDDYEVIVINDGSVDDSGQVLNAIAAKFEYVRVMHRTQPSGYGGVLRGGFAAATKDWIFYTDGDAQYDVRELAQLAARVRDGVDMVNGYKIKRHDPLHRIIIGLAYQYFVKLIFSLSIHDVDCDFRLMKRSIFDHITLESTTGTITFELVKKIQDAGYTIVEVPVHHWYRQYGQSQFFNFRRVGRTLLALINWWWRLVVKKEHLRSPQAH